MADADADDDYHHFLGLIELSVSIQTPTHITVTYMIFEASVLMKIDCGLWCYGTM
jgi:hypothetical protein